MIHSSFINNYANNKCKLIIGDPNSAKFKKAMINFGFNIKNKYYGYHLKVHKYNKG